MRDLGEAALPEEKAMAEEGEAASREPEKKAEEVGKEEEGKPINMEKETSEHPKALAVPESVHVTIDRNNLKDYVGPPIFTSDRLYDITPPGVVMGLAWTQMGGAALYVESILETALTSSSRPALERTGNLRDVMKESTLVAYAFARSMMSQKFPQNHFFDKAKVHLHCPEGAVPKDGEFQRISVIALLLYLGSTDNLFHYNRS